MPRTHATFTLTMHPEASDDVDGVSVGRVRFEKLFQGGLVGRSTVQMLAARTPEPGTATYVALERVTGVLDGREGTFVLHHVGLMERGAQQLTIAIAPGTGTGALRGLSGGVTLRVVDGLHHYTVDYELP